MAGVTATASSCFHAGKSTAAALFLSVTLIILSVFTSSALSRSLAGDEAAQLRYFDVAAALQQARDFLSFDPQTRTQQAMATKATPPTFRNSSSSSSSSFSLSLYPRGTIYRTHYKDYKSFVLALLDRDSARVDYLTGKLQLALQDETNKEVFRPEDLSTPVTPGGTGEYFTRIGVGTPAKLFNMVLDTGSDIFWLQCQPCPQDVCYEQTDPIFDPSGSSSYKPLSCASQQCQSLRVSDCRNGQCLYGVQYGDGSITKGDFVTETLTFGGSGTVDTVAIGCGHDNEGLFKAAAGLIGLGGGALSLTTQLKATSLSYCLVDLKSAGSSTLDFNSGLAGNSVTAPLLKNSRMDSYYYVGVSAISVGGQTLSIPSSVLQLGSSGTGGIIVDSGTPITRLRTEAYDALRDAFVAMTPNLKRASSPIRSFDTCYDLSGQTTVKIPEVSLHFEGGQSWQIPTQTLLLPVDNAGTVCLAFLSTTAYFSILGNIHQQGTRVSFDLAGKRIGFSSNNC